MKKVYGLVLAALFGMGVIAQAESQPTFHGKLTVIDNAGSFSEAGMKKAKDEFHGTTFKADTHLTVVTMSSVPESKKDAFNATRGDKTKASRFFDDWAHDIGKSRREKGVLILIYTESERFFVKAINDRETDVSRHMTPSELTDIETKLVAAWRSAKGKPTAEAKSIHDGGLHEATESVIAKLKDTSVPHATGKNHSDSPTGEKKMSIGGWICIGIAAILVIWLIIGVIRALTGGGGGGYGGGGYGGGGGGGFMTSMMGGMFGAMAGMWMYNQFMGGNHSSDYGNSGDGSGGGNDTGNADTGAGDFDNGASGDGGGDWGDSGGGDTGGGGDWGGGGDGGGGGGDW